MPELKFFAETSIAHLRLALEAGQIGVWELDLATGQAWRTPQHDRVFGYDELLESWTYEQFLEHVVPEDRAEVDRRQTRAIENGEEWTFECRIMRADGKERWISAAGAPLRDDTGQIVKLIGHVVDITHARQRETRLKVLTQELNHRVRNMLSIMRAIIKLSSRGADDVPRFAESLEGRIAALARTHDLFVDAPGERLTPRQIVSRELAVFPEFADRLMLHDDGANRLDASAVQGLSLVIHELITNAIKYGAFSNEEGKVSLTIRDLPGQRIELIWTERDGPQVVPPRTNGFGTRMMQMILGNEGAVELEYDPAGVICRIVLDHAHERIAA